MRWVRRVLVAMALAAPIAVVVVVARPDGDSVASEARGGGSGPDGALVDGDRVDGELTFGEVAAYRAVGEGSTRIGATAPGFDLTITVRDGGGDEVASNDDANSLDPEVIVDLDDGEEYTVEVRELNSQSTTFTVYVET